jgi:hypothetical protein
LGGYAYRIHRFRSVGKRCCRHIEGGSCHRGGIELDQTGRRHGGREGAAVKVLDGGVGADDPGSHTAGSDIDDQDGQGASLSFPDRSEGGG